MKPKVTVNVISDRLPKDSKRIKYFLILSIVIVGIVTYIREEHIDNYFLMTIAIISLSSTFLLGIAYGFMDKFLSIGRLTIDNENLVFKTKTGSTEIQIATIKSITLHYDGYQYEPYFTGNIRTWMDHKEGSDNLLIVTTDQSTAKYRILISSQSQFDRINKLFVNYNKLGLVAKII